ncbi:metal-dependent transcriptional regulator [Oligoflexia bacterium]|nr:metal-dependent transcriptional regulator [Oligoflexia bacterium]
MTAHHVEEILEALWTCSEKKEHHIDKLRECCHVSIDHELLLSLEQKNLIAFDGELVLLTQEGRKQAAQVIRRHRLAERLLIDILNMPLSDIEKNACEFEHMLAPQVEESICTLLGHPTECPHGMPIPEGQCCKEARAVVDNVVVPLDRLDAGQEAKVAYLRTSNHSRLHKLVSFGLSPGVRLKVHQTAPSFVISCEQTDLALDEDVASNIYVWRDQ